MATVKCAATDCLLSNMAASISGARNDVTVKILYRRATLAAERAFLKPHSARSAQA